MAEGWIDLPLFLFPHILEAEKRKPSQKVLEIPYMR